VSSNGKANALGSRSVNLRDTCQLLALGAFALCACSRTGLEPGDLESTFEAPAGTTPNLGDPAPTATATTPPPAPTPSTTVGATPAPTMGPTCVPAPEACNGLDDDCNGEVDDLPAQACPGGGFRYCVAGKLSSCPQSCEVCVPGSVRVCTTSFCTFWGTQECSADGQGFGPCSESKPPASCAAVAAQHKDSRELEQCCLDDGYCCLDSHDLDGDGDRNDMLGACTGVSCP